MKNYSLLMLKKHENDVIKKKTIIDYKVRKSEKNGRIIFRTKLSPNSNLFYKKMSVMEVVKKQI